MVLAAAACGRGPRAGANARLRSGALAGSNVLLVTIDTLRADRVGAYSGVPLTPALDRLAARGVRFADARAHAPLTLPAHASILTGLAPTSHGVHNNGSTALAGTIPTLATLLHDAGYRTGAFVGAFVLDARFGLERGFDTYDDRVGSDTGPITFGFAERAADRVTSVAAEWILGPNPKPQIPNPWFAWIHLFDPHAPYRAPEQRAPNPYDNEVAFVDAQLGALFDRLQAAGQLDRTLIILVADHGEALGDHGEATHGLFAYDATLRIPLIIAGPSIAPAVSTLSVGQADILPTVLELLGLGVPPGLDGVSLLPSVRGEAMPPRPIYFEALDAYLTRRWAPLTGVVFDGWKYIDLPDAELFALASDAAEARNRIGDEAPRAAVLAERLKELAARAAAVRAPAALIDPDAAARLRALGYTAGQPAADSGKRFTSADDPKRLLDLDRQYELALTLTGERRYGEAAALLQKVIAARPDFAVAYLNLASVLMAAGQPQRAVTLIEDAAAHGVTTPELQGRLGAAYLAAGQPARAAVVLDPVAKPETAGGLEAMNTLGIALTELGRPERARRLLSDVLAKSPRSATTWSNLGLLELSANRPSEAARAFEQAVAADPRLGQAWGGLGAVRARADPAGAIHAWKRAVELEPGDYDVLFNLSVLLRDQGRADEARPYVDRFIREAPPDRYRRDINTMKGWLRK